MTVPYPREPTLLELWNRSNWTDGMFSDDAIRGDRIAERQIPSYLWEHWKGHLQNQGYSWQRFQSDISPASRAMQEWGTDDADWEDVLEAVEQALEIELAPDS